MFISLLNLVHSSIKFGNQMLLTAKHKNILALTGISYNGVTGENLPREGAQILLVGAKCWQGYSTQLEKVRAPVHTVPWT